MWSERRYNGPQFTVCFMDLWATVFDPLLRTASDPPETHKATIGKAPSGSRFHFTKFRNGKCIECIVTCGWPEGGMHTLVFEHSLAKTTDIKISETMLQLSAPKSNYSPTL